MITPSDIHRLDVKFELSLSMKIITPLNNFKINDQSTYTIKYTQFLLLMQYT
jgi:hypothetical protein